MTFDRRHRPVASAHCVQGCARLAPASISVFRSALEIGVVGQMQADSSGRLYPRYDAAQTIERGLEPAFRQAHHLGLDARPNVIPVQVFCSNPAELTKILGFR